MLSSINVWSIPPAFLMTTFPLPEEREATQRIPSYRVQEIVPSSQQGLLHQKQGKKKLISLGARLIVTFLLFAFLFKSFSWTAIWIMLTHIHRAVALMGLTVGFCTLVVSAYQWQGLLNTEKIFVDLTRLINLYVIGIAFNHFLPTSMGGDVVKAYYVGRDSGNSPGSARAVMMTRITGFFGMILVALPALLIWRAHFTEQIVFWMIASSFLVLVAIGSVFSLARIFPRLIQLMSIQGTLAWILPRIVREKVARSSIFAKGMQIGYTLSKSVSHSGSTVMAVLFGILFHITACLNYYSYGLALHMDVPLYFYFVAIPLVSLIAFLPISVNGFGVRESSLVYIFSTAHVPVTTSLLLAFAMDLQMLIFAALGGCIYFFMGSRQKQIQKRQKEGQIIMQSTDNIHLHHYDGTSVGEPLMSNSDKSSEQGEQSLVEGMQDSASAQGRQEDTTQNPMLETSSVQKPTTWENIIQVPTTDVSLSDRDIIEQEDDIQTSTVRDASVQEMPEDVRGTPTAIMSSGHRQEKQSTPLFVSVKETSTEVVSQKAATFVSTVMKKELERRRLSPILSSFQRGADKKKLFAILAWSVVGLLVASGVLVWLYLRNSTPTVTLYRATVQDVKLYTGGGGTVFPQLQINLSYPLTEHITDVYVKPGDKVKANQQLGKIDLSQLNAQITQAANDVASAQVYLQSVRVSGNLTTIAQAQDSYNVAQDRYNALTAQASSPTLQNGALIAPVDGVVTQVNANPGEVFPANTPLITIMDESAVTVHIKVPITDFSSVNLNQTALVNPSALPDLTVKGMVTNIIPQADPQTDTFEVWVGVDNKAGKLLSGMNSFVRLERDVHAIIVPRLAILNISQYPKVFVFRNQRAYLRQVQIGGFSEDSVVISGGLSSGDTVIMLGQYQLQDGQAVNVQTIEGPKKA